MGWVTWGADMRRLSVNGVTLIFSSPILLINHLHSLSDDFQINTKNICENDQIRASFDEVQVKIKLMEFTLKLRRKT